MDGPVFVKPFPGESEKIPCESGKVQEWDNRSESTGDASVAGVSEPASIPSSPNEDDAVPQQSLSVESVMGLPSLGSAGHFSGNCSRCCFHPKGRCENGYNCRFCHYDHEKRRRKKTSSAAPQASHNWATAWPIAARLGAIPAPVAQSYARVQQMQPIQGPGPLPAPQDVSTADAVSVWLTSIGVGHCAEAFRVHRITGDVLHDLNQQDLVEIGVQALGDRKRILRATAQMNAAPLAVPVWSVPPPPVPPPSRAAAPPAFQYVDGPSSTASPGQLGPHGSSVPLPSTPQTVFPETPQTWGQYCFSGPSLLGTAHLVHSPQHA